MLEIYILLFGGTGESKTLIEVFNNLFSSKSKNLLFSKTETLAPCLENLPLPGLIFLIIEIGLFVFPALTTPPSPAIQTPDSLSMNKLRAIIGVVVLFSIKSPVLLGDRNKPFLFFLDVIKYCPVFKFVTLFKPLSVFIIRERFPFLKTSTCPDETTQTSPVSSISKTK